MTLEAKSLTRQVAAAKRVIPLLTSLEAVLWKDLGAETQEASQEASTPLALAARVAAPARTFALGMLLALADWPFAGAGLGAAAAAGAFGGLAFLAASGSLDA